MRERILEKIFKKEVLFSALLIFVVIISSTLAGNCFAMLEEKDTISELSFSHDGKKVVFDRCRNDGCQIQV